MVLVRVCGGPRDRFACLSSAGNQAKAGTSCRRRHAPADRRTYLENKGWARVANQRNGFDTPAQHNQVGKVGLLRKHDDLVAEAKRRGML